MRGYVHGQMAAFPQTPPSSDQYDPVNRPPMPAGTRLHVPENSPTRRGADATRAKDLSLICIAATWTPSAVRLPGLRCRDRALALVPGVRLRAGSLRQGASCDGVAGGC